MSARTRTQPPAEPIAGVPCARAAVAAFLAATLPAMSLADPMRPLAAGARAGSDNAAPRATEPARTDAAAVRSAEPRLVAIRQDSQGRWHALFDERWLGVGDRLGGRQVASIDADRVQLRQGRQTQTLHLLPVLQYRAESRETPAPATRPPAAVRPAARRAAAISTAQTAGEATP